VQRNQKRSAVKLADVLTDRFAEYEARSQGAKPPGLACGFYDLDAMTQGFQPTDFIVIAGRPGSGKTSLAMQIARNISEYHDLPTLFFSLEMSTDQLADRLVSMDSQIESGRLRSGRIQEVEWDPLGHSISRLSKFPVYIDETFTTSVSEIASISRLVAAEHGGRLGGIFVDYIQLMLEGGESDVSELSKITRQLKRLAMTLNCPVFGLSQLSRAVEQRTNKRPIMSDLRQSGSIEQDANLILMLYRDEYYNPDSADRGIAEVIISKHRNGPTGTIKLLFENQFTRFRNLGKPGG
jgi:replicative DNA helicase